LQVVPAQWKPHGGTGRGHVLRLRWNDDAPMNVHGPVHTFELVAEIYGYIHQRSKRPIPRCVHKAAAGRASTSAGLQHLLIAGGQDEGLAFPDTGPLLSKRVKHLLVGSERKNIARPEFIYP